MDRLALFCFGWAVLIPIIIIITIVRIALWDFTEYKFSTQNEMLRGYDNPHTRTLAIIIFGKRTASIMFADNKLND